MATVAELRELTADNGDTKQAIFYGDGVQSLFVLPGCKSAVVAAVTVAKETVTAYTSSGNTILFAYAPAATEEIVVSYTAYLHSTASLTSILARQTDLYRAAAEVLLIRAADPALLAISINRGGYQEDRTRAAAALREQAKSFLEMSKSVPSEHVDAIATDIFSYNHDELLDRIDETYLSDE